MKMRGMKQLSLLPVVLAAFHVSAQTNVTTAAPTTTGTVPVFGPSSSSTVTNSVITQSGNNVGIGTTNPTDVLTVSGGGIELTNSSSSSITSGVGLGPDTSSPIFNFSYTNSQGTYLMRHYGMTILPNSSPEIYLAGYGGLGLVTSGLNRIWINGSGNVGIGTTNPQAKFEINGSLRFTADGSVQTTAWTGVLCGGDYSEAVETTEIKSKYEPGDVLVISGDAEGKVQKSGEPYATNVSGIYATKPGVVGKRESIAKVSDDIPMAMVGIVPTKVTAENGAIHPGDLLVTSSRAGYAMKGTDRTRMLGAVIGKAMGSLESGSGTIEVLVTLQ